MMRAELKFLVGTLIVSAAIIVISGCVKNAEERAENVLVAGQYQIAIDKCVNTALASLDDGGARSVVGDDYAKCADKADAVYGRTGDK